MMNNSSKGALLSGLVYPGLGQVVLKHYKFGIMPILAASISLMIITVSAVQQALIILEEIESASGIIDMDRILDAVTQASNSSDSLIYNSMLPLLILCWIIWIVDGCRIGKEMDIIEQSISQISNNKDTYSEGTINSSCRRGPVDNRPAI
jgi:hypothetical protein